MNITQIQNSVNKGNTKKSIFLSKEFLFNFIP